MTLTSPLVSVVLLAVKMKWTLPSSFARTWPPRLASANTGLSRPLGTIAIVYVFFLLTTVGPPPQAARTPPMPPPTASAAAAPVARPRKSRREMRPEPVSPLLSLLM